MPQTKDPKIARKNAAKGGSNGKGKPRRRHKRARGQKTFDLKDPKLDKKEIMSLACNLFINGELVSEIADVIMDNYPEAGYVTREQPYKFLGEAAARGWLKYHAPAHLVLAEEIRRRYPRLKGVQVAHTTEPTDVAREGALMLRGMVQELHREQGREEVHIGFAAGFSMQHLAREFADLLCEPAEHLPKVIVLHALVAGYDPNNPTTDPNAFFVFFDHHPVLNVQTRYVALHSPTMVRKKAIRELKQYTEIKLAFDAVDELDIIATSGSKWDDEHSSLKQCLEQSPQTLRKLLGKALIDLCWRPVGKDGPIEIEEDTDVQAMTLIQLSSLPKMIREGKKVLMLLGPCCICNEPKGRVLGTVLNLEETYVTHVVVDSRTARQVVGQPTA